MKNLLFVDDEPRILQGLQRQLYSMRSQWQMTFVDGGVKALGFLSANPVDVIVTDMMMPGMDGAELLTEVMKRHPNTVRIVLSGHADRESVLRLVGPAHQYLSKPCDAEELRNAISRAFTLRDMLGSDAMKQLATRLCALPTLPARHSQLSRELSKDDASLEVVAQIISQDIGMTAKILQLVNSAFFGLPQGLTSPEEAVTYLGLATVRSLVLSIQIFSQFNSKAIHGFSIEALTDHCWATAVMSRRIAEFERADPRVCDQCFLAGMLHHVGQLVLAHSLPEDYGKLLEIAHRGEKNLLEAEREQFSAIQSEVGAYLLGLWGLPNVIVEAVAFHHSPAAAPVQGFSPLIAVCAASRFANEQANTPVEDPEAEIDETCMGKRGLSGRLELWREHCLNNNL